MQPDTKYAKSGDVRVAYQVTGEGPDQWELFAVVS